MTGRRWPASCIHGFIRRRGGDDATFLKSAIQQATEWPNDRLLSPSSDESATLPPSLCFSSNHNAIYLKCWRLNGQRGRLLVSLVLCTSVLPAFSLPKTRLNYGGCCQLPVSSTQQYYRLQASRRQQHPLNTPWSPVITPDSAGAVSKLSSRRSRSGLELCSQREREKTTGQEDQAGEKSKERGWTAMKQIGTASSGTDNRDPFFISPWFC